MKLLYLDSSAIVKLVAREPESGALRDFPSGWPERASSALARVEVIRAARRAEAGQEVLSQKSTPAFWMSRAAWIPAVSERSALSIGEDLGAFVTYDERVANASKAAGIEAVAPTQ